jgi:hypothetical protein
VKIDKIWFSYDYIFFHFSSNKILQIVNYVAIEFYGILLHRAPCIEITKATFKTRDVH